MDFGFAAIPAIVTICYLAAEAVKTISLNNKWIPVICGTIGGALGIAALHVMPDYPAADYITATAIGIASGFAATGVNQACKQLKR